MSSASPSANSATAAAPGHTLRCVPSIGTVWFAVMRGISPRAAKEAALGTIRSSTGAYARDSERRAVRTRRRADGGRRIAGARGYDLGSALRPEVPRDRPRDQRGTQRRPSRAATAIRICITPAAPAAASSSRPTAAPPGFRSSIASPRRRSARSRSRRRTSATSGSERASPIRATTSSRATASTIRSTAARTGRRGASRAPRTSRASPSIRATGASSPWACSGRVSADDPNRGVYVTRDGGAHWTRTLYVGPSSGVSSLVRVPDRPATLFAGVWQVRRIAVELQSGGPLGGIYRSDDGGATWRRLRGNGLPNGAHRPDRPSRGDAFTRVCRNQSRAGELWRSDDGGVHWRKMPHSPYLGARAFYFTASSSIRPTRIGSSTFR